jgi:hypothetical protein
MQYWSRERYIHIKTYYNISAILFGLFNLDKQFISVRTYVCKFNTKRLSVSKTKLRM